MPAPPTEARTDDLDDLPLVITDLSDTMANAVQMAARFSAGGPRPIWSRIIEAENWFDALALTIHSTRRTDMSSDLLVPVERWSRLDRWQQERAETIADEYVCGILPFDGLPLDMMVLGEQSGTDLYVIQVRFWPKERI